MPFLLLAGKVQLYLIVMSIIGRSAATGDFQMIVYLMRFKATHDSAEDEIMTNNILQLDAILEPTILNKYKRFVQLHCGKIAEAA